MIARGIASRGRVAAALALVAAALLVIGCQSRRSGRAFRLGYFPNITHGQALVGAGDGSFARALGGRPLEFKVFNAGPAAMEALLAGEIDMTYVGATPAIIGYVRSHGGLRVVAGAAAGGAVLVVRDAKGPRDLIGKRIAAPQIGNTQDVALRHWLAANGLDASDAPGRDVTVLPLANPDILQLFSRGEIDGAWVPEPWGARLVAEGGGHILVDERTLWPGGRFPTTVLVATTHALAARRAEVEAIVRAHLELTARWKADPAAFQAEVNANFKRLTGKALKPDVLRAAFSRLDPVTDPMEAQLEVYGRWTQDLGYLPRTDLGGLVDASPLVAARR